MYEDPDPKKSHVLTNYDLTLLIDGLDELRKSNSVGINELLSIATLAEKMGSWLSEVRFGIDLANVSKSSSNALGINIMDERPEKESLGKVNK